MEIYIDIPKEIIEAANKDPILSGYIKEDRKRVGIYYGKKIVGFYQPTEIVYKGKTYSRTGNIFILEEYRGHGLGTKTIIDFFSDKERGLSYVAANNKPSLKMFENAGFIRDKSYHKKNSKCIELYLMIKEKNISNEAFAKW